MSTAGELLDEKGRLVFSIDADATVFEAVELMAEKNIGALTVSSGDNAVAGILSERDYARKVILKGRSSRDTKVKEIMSAEVVSAHNDTLLDQCMALMLQNRFRHLPILDHGNPVGVITLGDIMKTIIREQSQAIEELESFIVADEGGEG